MVNDKDFNFDDSVIPERRVLQYEKFESWLDAILGGDNLLDKHIPLNFWFAINGLNMWELRLCTVNFSSNHNDFQEPVDMKFPYVCNTLCWDAVKDKEAAEKEVIEFLKRYLKSGK